MAKNSSKKLKRIKKEKEQLTNFISKQKKQIKENSKRLSRAETKLEKLDNMIYEMG
jgi:septal ring factor EnvC (AmiA/AmiB activator)